MYVLYGEIQQYLIMLSRGEGGRGDDRGGVS